MRPILAALICLAAIVSGTADARAAKRVALVIGNSAYEHATVLRNSKADATAMAALLRRLEFEVVLGTDLKHRDFADAVNAFSEKLYGADVALLFYAGHGLQVHGQNYLAPIDARLKHEAGLAFEAVRLSTIQALMERRNRTSLVFLDACRDNPLARTLARNMGTRSAAVGRGWARVESGVGTLIAFATQPGNVALDGEGRHSPFTEAFIRHAETPGQDIEGLMRRVRVDVIEKTNGSQIPWSHSSLTQRFRFLENQTAKSGSDAKEQPTSRGAQDTLELAFWQAARGNGSKAAYEVYLQSYPNGAFAPLARLEIERLKREHNASGKPPASEKAELSSDGGVTKKFEVATAEPTAVAPEQAKPEPALSGADLALAVQRELKRVGCYTGGLDGDWGRGSRAGLARFAKFSKFKIASTKPTLDVFEAIKAQPSRVCPIACGPRQKLSNGRCVPKTCPQGEQLTRTGKCVVTKPKTQAVKAKKSNQGKCNPAAIARLAEKIRQDWMDLNPGHAAASGVCFRCREQAQSLLCRN